MRHFTRLSQLNFSIDSHFYPLGSCTMKYNPKACNTYAMLPEFLGRHPLAPEPQGFLACMFELQEMLKEITGMQGVSLSPMAGAQGEFAGVAMIRAYHRARNDTARTEIIVPQAAHGTNPATATMCGCTVKEIPCDKNGGIDLEALEAVAGPATAGIMLTNPSTLGVFEHRIAEVARIVHQAGGLLYYDGANLNAILGKVRPGDMGFDVIHMNLHKTFSTPHGGGGPGSGAVGVGPRLLPFLPIPLVGCRDGRYRWLTERELPSSIGRLSGFMGNAGVNLRAYVYMRMLGRQGMVRVSEFAALNANYLMKRLTAAGYEAAYPARRASHEFIITLRSESRLLRGHRDGCRQAPAGFRGSCADDLFPAAGARMPADRAHRDRDQGRIGPFLRRDAGDPPGNGTGARETAVRSAYNAGPAAGRREGGETARYSLEAGSLRNRAAR